MALVADECRRAFEGVSDAWLAVLDEAAIRDVLRKVGKEDIAPPLGLVLEAFRYAEPEEISCVIVGQDPYPTPGHAQGLCFSAPLGAPIPDSLKRVFGCLERAGYLRPGVQRSGDLRPWATQGVLLLNAALTTRVGVKRAHAAHWKPVVDGIVRRLCARPGPPIHFMLWGGDARALAPAVRASGHVALEWSHPSPTADNCTPEERRFRNFEGFEIVNEFLSSMDRRPIAWDNLPPCMAMADGSCPANGKPGARASFAVVFACDQLGSPIIRGEVRPCVYEFVDTSVPEMGLRATGAPATPSNNRGELMGIIAAMIAMLRWRALGRCQIVSDSQISIRTLLEWLPDRIRKRKEHELKNLDLVMIAWRLLGELRGRAASVELIHTRGHQGPPPAGATNRERLIHRGNELADTHAGTVVSAGPPTYAVEVLNCAPALRRRLFVCE